VQYRCQYCVFNRETKSEELAIKVVIGENTHYSEHLERANLAGSHHQEMPVLTTRYSYAIVCLTIKLSLTY